MTAPDTQLVNPVDIAYLATAILFILGLRYLSSPKTARLGNRLSALGMLIAVVATLTQQIANWTVVAAGLVVGAVVGIVSAQRVKMTAMPQMVALFNGAGGGAASLVAAGELLKYVQCEHADHVRRVVHQHADGGDRRDLVCRLHRRFSQAARSHDGPPDHVSRPASRQRADPARHPRDVGDGRRGRAARARIFLDRAGRVVRAGHPVRAADRRRRHAGRHLAAQLVHRPRGRVDRVRARQQRADRRRARWWARPVRCSRS